MEACTVRILYGVNPVREALRAGGEGVSELWLAEGGSRGAAFAELERLGRGAGAKVRAAPRQKLDRLAGTDRHQGVVAVVADFRYAELDELVALAQASGRAPLLVVLDGVEDPHNLGAIIRSAHALGAHGVIIPKDRAVGVTPAVAKASAGAIARCPVARVTNVAKSLEALKEAGSGRSRSRRTVIARSRRSTSPGRSRSCSAVRERGCVRSSGRPVTSVRESP
jgi:23S rRNA (guanosine2251-2'-O)-methyltransferase